MAVMPDLDYTNNKESFFIFIKLIIILSVDCIIIQIFYFKINMGPKHPIGFKLKKHKI